jgi:hypothetical protein
MLSPEIQSKITMWRMKAANGTITEDEMREAVAALRESRLTAAAQPTKSKSGGPKAPVNADALLNQLEGL